MRAWRLLAAMVIGLVLLPTVGPRPLTARAAACEVFPQTGKAVCDPFRTYWEDHGGLDQQGLPLTDTFDEASPSDGKTYRVQYFERARFELHPENAAPYEVLLGLLGNEQGAAKYPAGPPAPIPGDPFNDPAAAQDCATFAQTGRQVCGPFLAYWQGHGALAQQGLPLTAVFLESNPTDGRAYPTQYFERARFEYHAEFAGTTSAVLLGLLGREQLLAKYPGGIYGPSPAPSPPPQPTPVPSAAPVPPAAPHLSVSPPSGPAGTKFAITGTGFPAGATIAWAVAGGNTGSFVLPAGQTSFLFTVTTDGTPPGAQTVRFSANGAAPLAISFTITGTPAPLPDNYTFFAQVGGPACGLLTCFSGKTAYVLVTLLNNGQSVSGYTLQSRWSFQGIGDYTCPPVVGGRGCDVVIPYPSPPQPCAGWQTNLTLDVLVTYQGRTFPSTLRFWVQCLG